MAVKTVGKTIMDYKRISGVSSLTVGCADCDVRMYRSLGFSIALGNHIVEMFIEDGIHLTHEARLRWANEYIKPVLEISK